MILSSISSIKSIYQFEKIIIDFEYMNNLYTTIAQPYNTLIELKEKIMKKIFPKPKGVHCFYKNLDINEKEDEQISSLFPFRKKIKVILKKPSKEKHIIKSYKSFNYLETKSKPNTKENRNVYPKIEMNSDSTSVKNDKKFKIKIKKNNNSIINNNYNYNKIKKKLFYFSSLLDNQKERKKSQEMLESVGNEYLEKDELFYYLHKNKINKYKLMNDNYENNEYDNDNDIIKTSERKYPHKKLKKLSFSKKDNKSRNNYENNNIINNHNNCMTQRGEEDTKINRIRLKKMEYNETNDEPHKDSFQDDKISNEDNIDNSENEDNNKNNEDNNNKVNDNNININNNQIIEDENYICPSCKNNMITTYCLNCNKFICNNCIEKCILEKHENIKINVNNDCLSNINSYRTLILSNIEKKINDIQEYNNDLKIYDIKKKRDNLISMFNEIINLYSQITKLLKNIYKEKDVNVAMSKYKLDSDKIKEEINEIIHKAESYLKSDDNNNKPKFKIMNIKYFFNLINEKKNNHKKLSDSMNIYSLNSNINSNIEKSLNEIEEIMKNISNKEKSFELKDDLKKEYDKLIKDSEIAALAKDKKKLNRRKSVAINLNKNQFSIFPANVLLENSIDKK